jgi:hypothetical protein
MLGASPSPMRMGGVVMRVSGKDIVTTVFMGMIVAVYVAYLRGADLPLIASTRGTTAAVLILGVVGGCALGTAGELYAEKARPRLMGVFMAIANTLGAVAGIAALIGLITESELALAILVAATLALWLTATARHIYGSCSTPTAERHLSRDDHEVIGR